MAPCFVTCVQPTYSFCPPHTHTPNKRDLWYFGSSAVRWCEEAAASECELSSALPEVSGSGEAKNKRPEKSPRSWRQTWMCDWMCCSCKTQSAKQNFLFYWEYCSFFFSCTIKILCNSIRKERRCSRAVWKLRSNSEWNKESDWTILIHWEMLNWVWRTPQDMPMSFCNYIFSGVWLKYDESFRGISCSFIYFL